MRPTNRETAWTGGSHDAGPVPSRARVTVPGLPALVVGSVWHERREPVRHNVRMRSYLWLVDLDELPGGRSRFRAEDHFSGTDPSIRAGLQRFAAAAGEPVHNGDRVVMLAAARQGGHVFNPLSVHWCMTADDRVRFAVLEIHNTYGERHAHLVYPDDRGTALVDKQFYVSPFFEVDGRYRVRLNLRADRVLVSIVLEREGRPVFTAVFRGIPVPATRLARWRAALRTPAVTRQVSARIRWHGIRLWRKLPIQPRPTHRPPWAATSTAGDADSDARTGGDR